MIASINTCGMRYEVTRLCRPSTIIPFFEKHPLWSSKRANYLDFKKVASMISAKEHLTQEGLNEIRLVKDGMNQKRSYQSKVDFMNSIADLIEITPGWLSGFIDAEGYFGVYASNKGRKRCELKLSIAQNAHDVLLLEAIAKHLNVGTKIVNNLGKDSSVLRLDIYRLETFASQIVPIFEQRRKPVLRLRASHTPF
jgi:hypothetical protein